VGRVEGGAGRLGNGVMEYRRRGDGVKRGARELVGYLPPPRHPISPSPSLRAGLVLVLTVYCFG